jgi:hypothetical protein
MTWFSTQLTSGKIWEDGVAGGQCCWGMVFLGMVLLGTVLLGDGVAGDSVAGDGVAGGQSFWCTMVLNT